MREFWEGRSELDGSKTNEEWAYDAWKSVLEGGAGMSARSIARALTEGNSIGFEFTKDAVQKAIQKYRKKQGFYIPVEKEERMKEEKGSDYTDRLFLTELKDKHYERMERRFENLRTFQALKMQELTEAISLLKPGPVIQPLLTPPDQLARDACSFVALLTDAHIGELVEACRTGGHGGYNINIALHRINFFADKVCEMVMKEARDRTVDEVVLAIGGDIPHNETMRGSAKMHAEEPISTQVALSARILEIVVRKLLRVCPNVRVVGVIGNHGRIGEKEAEDTLSNYDYMILEMLEMMTKRTVRGDVNLTFDIRQGVTALFEVQGYGFFLDHGHAMRDVFTQASATKLQKRANRLVDMERLRMANIRYGLYGHYHSRGSQEMGGIEYFCNGSVIGPTTYAVELGLNSEPSQSVFRVVPGFGVDQVTHIKLGHIDEEVAKGFDWKTALLKDRGVDLIERWERLQGV